MRETEGVAAPGCRTSARKTGGFLATPPGLPIIVEIRQKARCGIDRQLAGWASSFLGLFGAAMLIGYVRVSKSDGTQTLAPQRDAMLAAGVDPTRIYEDWHRVATMPALG